MKSPYRIVIVGRPNVGKSTLFNRLISKKKALVHNLPGVTRDRIETETTWWYHGLSFPMIITDTGGLGEGVFSEAILVQVKQAAETADVVLFVFDSQAGLTPLDERLYQELCKMGVMKRQPVIGVVNKVDDELHEGRIADFFQLSLNEICTVSSEHGRGIDDLKSEIFTLLGISKGLKNVRAKDLDAGEEPVAEVRIPRIPKIAILGRPNVGKSTLLNAILGESRVITSPIAGTTSDAIDVPVQLNGKPYLLIDTAGIRRKNKTEQGIEVLSVVQARKTLEKADLVLLVFDGEHGISDQDEKIGGLIEEAGCSIVLVMNKWDTQSKNSQFTREQAAETIRKQMAYLNYAPIVFVSALKQEGLEDLGELFEEVLHQKDLKLQTHELTEWVRVEATIHNPRNAKFYYCHQSGRRPPTFVCHVNDPEKLHFSLKRHLVNALRARWGYMGTPIRMLFIEGKNRRSLPKQTAASKAAKRAKQKAERNTKPKSPSKK